jgi:hypothetical protein
MTIENDIVIIHIEDKPSTFAKVESISADVKKDWFIIDLLLLQFPLQNVSWILRDIYINGEEFTMDGTRIRLEKVVNPEKVQNTKKEEANTGNAKIIPLASRKK